MNGFVVPVGDSRALAMRLDRLLQNARMRAEMSANAAATSNAATATSG